MPVSILLKDETFEDYLHTCKHLIELRRSYFLQKTLHIKIIKYQKSLLILCGGNRYIILKVKNTQNVQ